MTAPLIPYLMRLIGLAADKVTQKQFHLLGQMSGHFLDVLQGLKTLKALGQSRAQSRNAAQISDNFCLVTMQVLRVAFLSALVLELLATLSTALIAVEIGLRLLYGRLDFAQALFVLVLAPEYYLPLRLLGARFHSGRAGAAAATRITAILATPIPVQRTIPSPHPDEAHLEHVTVQYPDRAQPALSTPVTVDNLPEESWPQAGFAKRDGLQQVIGLPLRDARERFERDYLNVQITRFGGNISRTAAFIGMERSALHRKLKSLGVDPPGRNGVDPE